jgi:hypothetical protein
MSMHGMIEESGRERDWGKHEPDWVQAARSMSRARTPATKLGAFKDGLQSFAKAILLGKIDKVAVVDRFKTHAASIGMFKEFEPDYINQHIENALKRRSKPKTRKAKSETNGHAAHDDPGPSGLDDYGTTNTGLQEVSSIDLNGVVLSVGDWLKRDLPDVDCLMGELLSTTTRALAIAPTGLGKTNFFGMALGMRMAAGLDFLHWKAKRKARILYVDGEMSRRLLKKRLKAEVKRLPPGTDLSGFHAFSHEDIPGFAPLNTPAGQAIVEALLKKIGGVDFVIFDSVMCLTVGDMKDEESWQQTLPWAKSLTRRSIGQIWIHHTGHDETKGYGTKTREWQLDLVMLLQPVKRNDTDVSFKLTFPKARDRTPDNRADFAEVNIALVNDGWDSSEAPAEQKQKKTKRLSARASLVKDSLANLLCDVDGSSEKPPFSVPGNAKAVKREALRKQCYRAGFCADLETENARTKALGRAIEELQAARNIGVQDGWIWLAQAEPAAKVTR